MSVKSRLDDKNINCRHDLRLPKWLAKDIEEALNLENENRRLNNEKEVSKNSFIIELLDNSMSIYWVFERL